MARRNPLVHDAAVRTRFLDLVRAGLGRYEAARAVGLTPAQFTYAHDRSDEFRRQLEAALDASVEPVLTMLRNRAVTEGDVAAAKEYLRHQAPPPRGSAIHVNHTHSVELPSNLSDVAALADRLENRLAALEPGPPTDIEDAELVDEDDDG